MLWQSSQEIETRVDYPWCRLIRGKVVELALSKDVNVGVERVSLSTLAKLDNTPRLPRSYGRESWTPIPAKVILFFANPLAIRVLKGVDDGCWPVYS